MNITSRVLALLAVIALVTIYAAIRAFRAGNNGWGIACLVAVFIPFGFVVAVVYLLGPDRASRAHAV